MNGLRDMWDRTAAHRSWWIGGGVAALLVVCVFMYGLVNMVGAAIRVVSPPPQPPDVLATVAAHDNDAGLVALFAKYCVKQLVTASSSDSLDSLKQCFTLPSLTDPSSGVSPFPTTAATVTDLDVYTPQMTFHDAELSMWSVLVAATVKQFSAPAAVRQYFWLSVSLPAKGGPRAMMLPDVRAAALPAGVDVELAYTSKVSAASSLYGVVSGFLTSYLTGPASEVGKYVTAESGLVSLGSLYSGVTIVSMTADQPVDGPPASGAQAQVLVTIIATTADGGRMPMQYPLHVVDSAGRWAVAGLADTPATTGRILPPGR